MDCKKNKRNKEIANHHGNIERACWDTKTWKSCNSKTLKWIYEVMCTKKINNETW